MVEHASDATLLERFVTGQEEAAFAMVVRRHAAVVRSTCRRVLASEQDAEDIAQTTFLVLALKASDVRWRDSVAGWLCAVARRLALRARALDFRRLRHECPLSVLVGSHEVDGWGKIPEPAHPSADPHLEIARRDLRQVIEQELNRLPEKYRDPVVLCDMEGLTHEEAARQLGLPTGSMSRRLGRARSILRQRLASRGLPIAVGLLVGIVTVLGWVQTPRRSLPVPLAVVPHRLDSTFHPLPDGGLALQRWLQSVDRAGRVDTDVVTTATSVRQAGEFANSLGESDTAFAHTFWASAATTLQDAAASLSDAASRHDAPALLAAARRLNESCIQCHLVSAE